MLMRTRKGGSPDTRRMGRALSAPGMDPRVWASEAVVKKVNVASDGVYLDVLLIPDNVMETARWSTMYAGDGFGLYFPVRVDDTVLVVAPSGEPDYGLVAGPCWWSPAEAVPQDAIDNPNDALLVMQADRNVRFVTQGTGNFVLEPRGVGQVLLGAEAAVDAAIKGTTYRVAEDVVLAALSALASSLAAAPLTPPQQAAATALAAAITTFQGAAAAYLAQKVRVA